MSAPQKEQINFPGSLATPAAAFQILTREATSPTSQRLKDDINDAKLALAGGFKSNAVTRMVWHRTRGIAEALSTELGA